MNRFTISLEEGLASAFDSLIRERGYANRSEAVRDILRSHLQSSAEKRTGRGSCIANLSYVCDHHKRDSPLRLASVQHAHRDLTVSTMHAYLEHGQCIETVMLKGKVKRVREFADRVIAERGVRHGVLNLINVSLRDPRTHGRGTDRRLDPG